MALDDVDVHYRSAEPARRGALAFTRGRDIYVAPGQERNLPHEAWHVVQQAQGRVRSTIQLEDGSPANDDDRLEREADAMGRYANRVTATRGGARGHDHAPDDARRSAASSGPVQMVREDEFRKDPRGFLSGNVVSLTTLQGLIGRNANKVLVGLYPAFIKAMGRFERHWFKLVPDAARTTPTQPAYILTPAIEKYLEANPLDHLLAPAAETIHAALPIEGNEDYILAGYIDYLNIGADAADETTIGHTEITRSRQTGSDFNPDLIFTAAMNGCALTVTPSQDLGKFTAWHFQSTSANRKAAAAFRRARRPMDWYGEDEYDSNEHAGFFEVTNLLHRGDDDQWRVISQQNETSNYDASKIAIKQVATRPLELDKPDPTAVLRRVYLGMQHTTSAEIRDCARQLLIYKTLFPSEFQGSLQILSDVVNGLLDAEVEALTGTKSIQDLFGVAMGLLEMKKMNVWNMTIGAQALRKYLREREMEEKAAWFPDKRLIKDLETTDRNINDVLKFYGRMEWIELLASETAPQQPETAEQPASKELIEPGLASNKGGEPSPQDAQSEQKRTGNVGQLVISPIHTAQGALHLNATAGAGNCFFHSLYETLTETRSGPNEQQAQRQAVIDAYQHAPQLAQTNFGGLDTPEWNEFTSTILTEGSWAADQTPSLVADALRLEIVIHNPDGSVYYTAQPNAALVGVAQSTIHVYYDGGHYNSYTANPL